MSDDEGGGVVSALQDTVADHSGSVGDRLDTLNQEAKRRVDDTVSVVGAKTGDARDVFEQMGAQSRDLLRRVLVTIHDHLAENDLDVTVSENRILIEGDGEDLTKVQAELDEIGDFAYERDDGIHIDLD